MYSSSTGYSKHNALLVNPTTQKESLEELMGLGIVLLRLCVAALGILFGQLMLVLGYCLFRPQALKALEINHQVKILVEVEKSLTGRLLYLATSRFDDFSPKQIKAAQQWFISIYATCLAVHLSLQGSTLSLTCYCTRRQSSNQWGLRFGIDLSQTFEKQPILRHSIDYTWYWENGSKKTE